MNTQLPSRKATARTVMPWRPQTVVPLALLCSVLAIGNAWLAWSGHVSSRAAASEAEHGSASAWAPAAQTLLGLGSVLLLPLVVRRRDRVFRDRFSKLQLASNERWRALFEGSGEALVWCTLEGEVRAVNQRAQSLLGRDAAQLKGQTVPVLLRQDDAEGRPEADIIRVDGTRVGVGLERVRLSSAAGGGELWRLSDLTDQRDAEQQMLRLTNFDSLTGLPNRELFRDRLKQAMQRSRRSGKAMALMFLDLDRFKVVNDSLGHAVGDALLRHVADTLAGCLRSVDSVLQRPQEGTTISRLGGDEFTVIVEELTGADDAAMIARRMLEALAVPFISGEEEIVVSASIGISMYPTDDVDLDGLLRHTDMAMYRSKSLGRNTFSFFSDDLNTAVQSRMSLEGSLRRAIEREEFVLHYQPKADLKTGEITGVEALVRWNCPGKGMVPPDRFISVLEDTGLILPVGAWVIRKALAEMEQWDRQGLPPINVAVNLSARQLRHQFLTSMIEDTLQQRRIDPSRLELELTESLLMEDTEVTRSMLATFRRMGVRLAIDDFGTGHSSLSYLRRLEVDTLKIDRSFVSETPHDGEACAIASAIVALGNSMQIKLVAEGVETRGQAAFLRERGCNEIQGYLLTRPLPLPQLMEWFRQYEHDRRERCSALHEPLPQEPAPTGLLDLMTLGVQVQPG